MLGRIILGAFYGFIASLAWTFALRFPLTSGWIYGVIIGAIISLIIYFFSLAVASRGNVAKQEAYFVANMQSFFIFLGTIAFALIAWIVRLIFF